MSSSELVLAAARRGLPVAVRARRALLVRRIAWAAAAAGATVEADIALDVQVGARVRVEVAPGTASVLRVGAQSRLGEGVVLQLKGGTIEIGPWCDVRRNTVLNVSGRLTVGQRTVLGAGCTVHCAHEVHVGARVGIGEYATLVDTSHVHTAPDRPVVYDTVPGAVRVGDDSFVGTKATLTRRADVGRWCVIGAGSVVTGAVEDRTFVSGVPARVVRRVELPWQP